MLKQMLLIAYVVHSKEKVTLLLVHFVLLRAVFVDILCFCPCVLSVISNFTIILLGKRESWLLYMNCLLGFMLLLVLCISS